MNPIDRPYWDNRFLERKEKELLPEKAIVDYVFLLEPGTVLDLACGDGRNALYLAQHGYEVTGVDYSAEGLKILNRRAREKELSVTTYLLDLNEEDALNNIGCFDNIIISHYTPDLKLLSKIIAHLNPGGILLLCGLNEAMGKMNIRMMPLCFKKDAYAHVEGLVPINKYTEDDRGIIRDVYLFKK